MANLYLICIIILISILLNRFRPSGAERRKIVIDTDAGSDDAAAILLALGYENATKSENNFQVIAITCVYGNTYVSNVEQNVLKILTIANRSDIAVYVGAQKPLIEEYEASDFFGNDGFGDFNFTEKITAKVDKSKLAAMALIDIVKTFPGEITVMCLGPLTNIALAIALDPTFAGNVKELIIMGSSVAGLGNRAPNVEFNFGYDPESNLIVFNSNLSAPIVLLPWETVTKNCISKDYRQNVFGKRNSSVVDFLNKVDRIYLEKVDCWSASDVMTAGITIWPRLVKKFVVTNVTPVTDGMARGSVLVDYGSVTRRSKNARIIEDFSLDDFLPELLRYVK